MHITLTEQQGEDLGELLRAALSDLSAEIAGTDNPSYREGLRIRRTSFDAILLELSRAQGSSTDAR
jgi:hypothetical protein